MNLKEPLMGLMISGRNSGTHLNVTYSFGTSHSICCYLTQYYSKFPLPRKWKNIRSNTTGAHLKSIIEEHWIPNKLVTGNETQFTSALFQKSCSTYGFIHVTTSPYYPQGNGFIERTVETVKNFLQECKESGADLHRAMSMLPQHPT